MPEVETRLYKVISISGEDAVDFLQGQLTQDVTALPDRGSMFASWCNPKGRVIVTLRLFRLDGGIGLAVPEGMVDRVVQRLSMYRLRAKVEIAVLDVVTPDLESEASDMAALIRAGIPTIDETNSEEFTPHMLNLDKLGAVSFDKGCYTGQEVVARTEHLGKSKRRMMRYTADAPGISAGDAVTNGDRGIGSVVNAVGTELLAVTPVDQHDASLRAIDVTITPQGLPYDI
jgi:folate-binding protein YgfZ